MKRIPPNNYQPNNRVRIDRETGQVRVSRDGRWIIIKDSKDPPKKTFFQKLKKFIGIN